MRDIYHKAVETFGADNQLGITQEECAELIQAISKYKRTGEVENVIEEIADVQIMIEQLKIILNITDEDIFKYKTKKMCRLLNLIIDHEKADNVALEKRK